MDSPFFSPIDGYVYGWRWRNGDEAWWSTRELAQRHSLGQLGSGDPIRRAYVVGAVEDGHDGAGVPRAQLDQLIYRAVEQARLVRTERNRRTKARAEAEAALYAYAQAIWIVSNREISDLDAVSAARDVAALDDDPSRSGVGMVAAEAREVAAFHRRLDNRRRERPFRP